MSLALSDDTAAIDVRTVILRLEEAGATLLALPGSGWSTRLRTSSLEIVRTAIESYGWSTNHIRPPLPSPARITEMDEAMGWISLIPVERYVLRRIVGDGFGDRDRTGGDRAGSDRAGDATDRAGYYSNPPRFVCSAEAFSPI